MWDVARVLMHAGFEGSKCETPVTPTKKPSPGKSSGVLARNRWIVPLIIAIVVLGLIVLIVVLVNKRWRKREQAKFVGTAAGSSSFANPLYAGSEQDTSKHGEVIANPTYAAAGAPQDGEYAEVAVSGQYAEPVASGQYAEPVAGYRDTFNPSDEVRVCCVSPVCAHGACSTWTLRALRRNTASRFAFFGVSFGSDALQNRKKNTWVNDEEDA